MPAGSRVSHSRQVRCDHAGVARPFPRTAYTSDRGRWCRAPRPRASCVCQCITGGPPTSKSASPVTDGPVTGGPAAHSARRHRLAAVTGMPQCVHCHRRRAAGVRLAGLRLTDAPRPRARHPSFSTHPHLEPSRSLSHSHAAIAPRAVEADSRPRRRCRDASRSCMASVQDESHRIVMHPDLSPDAFAHLIGL
jgi:hypothetical protein